MAQAIRCWLADNGVATLYIEHGSSWENGHIELFNGRFRDELLDREVFYSVREARVLAEHWRLDYNDHRPHSGKYCFGKTPMQTFLDSVPLAKEKMLNQDRTDNRQRGVNVRSNTGYYTSSRSTKKPNVPTPIGS